MALSAAWLQSDVLPGLGSEWVTGAEDGFTGNRGRLSEVPINAGQSEVLRYLFGAADYGVGVC